MPRNCAKAAWQTRTLAYYVPFTAFVCLIAVQSQAWKPFAGDASQQKPLLKFHDGQFKIVIFADLHFGENAWTTWGPLQDLASLEVMKTVLDLEQPDFIVYLGDQLTANNLLSSNATAYWEMLTEPAASRKVPWAAVMGNHDSAPFEWEADWFGPAGIPGPFEFPTGVSYTDSYRPASSAPVNRRRRRLLDNTMSTSSRASLARYDASRPGSLTRGGDASLWPSVTNFALPVWPAALPDAAAGGSAAGRPAAFLYFLDSGGGSYPEVISFKQAQWFNESARKLNPDLVPELVFFHIPAQAYAAVNPAPTGKEGGKLAPPCVGALNYDPEVSAQAAEWGLLEGLQGRPSVKATFVGHNHGKDWCCPHGGLWLCFARHTGHGGYGDWIRGARVVRLREAAAAIAGPLSLDTWVRFEDGSIREDGVLGRAPAKPAP